MSHRVFAAATGVLVVLALAVHCGAAGPASSPATSPTTASAPAPIVVATYNINYGNVGAKDLEAIVALIKKSQADVVAVQETTDAAAGYFRKHLAKQYPEMIFQGAPAAGGLGILARKPLEKHYLPPIKDGGWFGTLIARTKLGGKDVWVVNVHLRATVPQGKTTIKGFMDLFAQTEDIRGREMRYILAEVGKLNTAKLPVIFLGDFNSPSKMAAPLLIAGNGYIDSFAAVNRQADSQPSWHALWQGVNYSLRIDYIYHGRPLRTLESNILEGGPSDHQPVVSKLQWAQFVTTAPAMAARAPALAPTPKTIDEALGSPESMAAGLRTGMAKKDMIGRKVSWKLLAQEVVSEGDPLVLKAGSESGFAVTCRVGPELKAQLEGLKADDPVQVSGAIVNLEYEKPQDVTDIFLARMEVLGVLLDATAVRKMVKPAIGQ